MIDPSEIDGEVLRALIVDLSEGSVDEGFDGYTIYGRARVADGRLTIVTEDVEGGELVVPESAWPRFRLVPEDADPAQFGDARYTVAWLVRSKPRPSS